MTGERALRLIAIAVYLVAMTAYIYAFEHRPDADYARENGPDELAVVASVAALHVAVGAAIADAFVLLLPVVAVFMAIPAGEYPGGWPELPVVFTILLEETFFGIPLVALGLVARRRWTRRHYSARAMAMSRRSSNGS